ncbi:MAG: peptidase and chymotrypsin/Hap [Proteobacteria bacterium]|nr:peptidase and chymotrypsin/Hap [Pseudomonadota bacterium]
MAVSLMSVLSRHAWLVAFLVLSSGPAWAFDEEYYLDDKVYGYEGDWRISVNVARKSCFMAVDYESDAGIEVGGYHRNGKMTYFFAFAKPSWKYINYDYAAVTIKYDRSSPWTGDGVGVKFGDYNGVAVEGVNVEAVNEFADAQYVNLKIDDRDLGTFPLAGSRKALAKMRECIAAIEDGRISLESIAREQGGDVLSSPTPAPKEDESERVDAPPGGKGAAPILGPSSTLGEEYYASDKFYAKEGNWWVFVTRARKSCSMAITYEGAAELEVGGDHRSGELAYFFMFSKPSWAYEEGEDYDVTIQFDRHSAWAGDGVGVGLTEHKGVAVEGVNVEAIDEFAAAKTLSLKIGSREHGLFDLDGSRKGLAKMRECIAAVEDGSLSLAEIAGEYEADASPPPPKPDNKDSHRGEETIGGPKDGEPGPDTEQGKHSEQGKESERAKEPTYASGSGFFVDGAGYLLTNAHVVEGCGNAMLRLGKDHIEPALIVAREKTHDLALLKMRAKSPAFAKFRGAPPIRLGESVVVFGYPLTDYLSKSGNLSTGLVASLAGVGDNEAEMQISAPVQSGNSGGAVVDQSGKVVGVVVAKSNIQTIDDDDIEVIQNANFAIKADVAKAFLDDHFVAYETEAPGADLKTPDVAEIARAFSAQVICEVTE